MTDFMGRFNAQTYALLRMVAGFLLLCHGSQKLFGFPGGSAGDAPPHVTYVAGPIELIAGTLVMLGLLTRFAAFLCSGLMAFAYWMAHGTNALLPIQNHGELAAIFCFVFLFVSAHGAGIWSLDHLFARRVHRGATFDRPVTV